MPRETALALLRGSWLLLLMVVVRAGGRPGDGSLFLCEERSGGAAARRRWRFWCASGERCCVNNIRRRINTGRRSTCYY